MFDAKSNVIIAHMIWLLDPKESGHEFSLDFSDFLQWAVSYQFILLSCYELSHQYSFFLCRWKTLYFAITKKIKFFQQWITFLLFSEKASILIKTFQVKLYYINWYVEGISFGLKWTRFPFLILSGFLISQICYQTHSIHVPLDNIAHWYITCIHTIERETQLFDR